MTRANSQTLFWGLAAGVYRERKRQEQDGTCQKTEKREEIMTCGEWMKDVRKRCHLNQAEMAAYLAVKTRNTIGHWESDRFTPPDKVIVQYAVLDYYNGIPKMMQTDLDERRKLLGVVQERMQQYTGRKLYSRDLYDFLLITAANGIIPFDKIHYYKEKLGSELTEVPLNKEEKKQLGLKRETIIMTQDSYTLDTEEEVLQYIRNRGSVYAIGRRTLGERMKERFESKNPGIKFDHGVKIYASKYQDDYYRIQKAGKRPEREWLIQFCIYMRFHRDEIDDALADAHYRALAPDSVRELPGCSVGSVKWFADPRNGWKDRFTDMRKKTVEEKMTYCTMLIAELSQGSMRLHSTEWMMPVDYYLERFPASTTWKDVLLKKMTAWKQEHGDAQPEEVLWEIRRMSGVLTERTRPLLQELRRETADALSSCQKEYLQCIKNMEGLNDEQKHELDKLRILASISYSIFTGKVFGGNLTQRELDLMQAEVEQTNESFLYFLNYFWYVFLGNQPLEHDNNGFSSRYRGRTVISYTLENVALDCCSAWMNKKERKDSILHN